MQQIVFFPQIIHRAGMLDKLIGPSNSNYGGADALLGKQLDVTGLAIGAAAQYIKNGDMRALALMADKANPALVTPADPAEPVLFGPVGAPAALEARIAR